ncbi:unnamed protein product [Cyclocybe aegerita]|uniref:P-loop containing nucleoside triphosphate hydrolase protein n=1 Tax=Cyclocybe aegerita TaxID=1973307 RepID=A0A8S0VRN0_CYCAE|nr:unnamed protein product [Cyclocybe aegerita]
MQAPPPFGLSKLSSPSFLGSNIFNRVMSFSLFAGLFQAGMNGGIGGPQGQSASVNYLWSSVALFVLGLLIETGRRFCQWLVERVQFQYYITAQFTMGDPTYEWLILFLTEKQIWKSSYEFRVSATTSFRKWGVKPDNSTVSASVSGKKLAFHLPLLADLIKDTAELATEDADGNPRNTAGGAHAEYVPTFDQAQLFKWRGYWAEIRRANPMIRPGMIGQPSTTMMYLTIYTRDMSVLSSFVEEARLGYLRTTRPHVTVHTVDGGQIPHPSMSVWNKAKTKYRRPLSSIVLQEGVVNSLVEDAREFLDSEDWYLKAGIPHRRGYLLYGPPGTGKTSTIYALAGELGLGIFSLSLAAKFVDDAFLARAVASMPKHSIFLIEDIDCAFPSARDEDDENRPGAPGPFGNGMVMGPMGPVMSGVRRPLTMVTLSGLLNVLDGVGSEEGKIFFATTNYIEHLDHALIRPGRIDKKVRYQLATQAQAEALYKRFYPEELLYKYSSSLPYEKPAIDLRVLASKFGSSIPEHEFSTAELQGFLLTHKKDPIGAADSAAGWVVQERLDREERKRKAAEKRAKAKAKREEMEATMLKARLARLASQAGPGGAVSAVIPAASDTTAAPTAPAVDATPKVNGSAATDVPLVSEVQAPTPPSLNGVTGSDKPGDMPNNIEGEAGTGDSAMKAPLVNGVNGTGKE